MSSEIEEIKQRLNIVEVLGEYLRLEKAGSNFRALCPFHNEKSPSFMVNEEKQFWHCFGCQKGGDIFTFVMEMEGLEFRDVLKSLAEKAGVELKKENPRAREEKNRSLEILELATKFYEVQLWKGEGRKSVLPYLKKRSLSEEIIKEFRLGYAPRGWRNILTFLIKRGYRPEEILRTGLLVQKAGKIDFYDRFRDRIMFPISDYSGRVIGYSARVSPGGDESQAKYINTPETEMYNKSRALYGIDKAKNHIKQADAVVLVEGNMDVIACHQAGVKNSVAVSGTALTPEQLDILKRYSKKIHLLFDMDGAGEKATKKSVGLALEKEIEVKVVTLPSGKDAADLVAENPEKLLESVKKPREAIDYFLEKSLGRFDRDTSSGKKAIAGEILEIVVEIKNEIERADWIKKTAEAIKTSETALTDMLKRAKLNRRESYREKERERSEEEKDFSREKIEILAEDIFGLAMSEEEIWKEASSCAELGVFSKNPFWAKVLERGKAVSFSADRFLAELSGEERSRAEKIVRQKGFRLNLRNELEEISLGEKKKEYEECLRALKIEIRKKELERISGDLRLAEKNRDLPAAGFLRSQFKKVAEELADLPS